jgi:hypothetical protein
MAEGLRFRQTLSHMTTLHRLGVLVPFVGSGMSLPTCTGWIKFLTKLAESAGVDIFVAIDRARLPQEAITVLRRAAAGAGFELPAWLEKEPPNIDSQVLYRLADSSVSALRSLAHQDRVTKYRAALQGWEAGARAEVTEQTESLALRYWPLVLTTNYDDLYWSAAARRHGIRPEVLGRSRDDCHRVLRSLDENTPPILWAVQGFLGGQVEETENVIADGSRQRELANQIVVGHQQYQRAINAEPHFRRAFAEVFRRRSLLFLGSGLLEDYLVNLLSETMHHLGPGPYPHFALLRGAERERYDPVFLQTRLGVVPVFYDDHGDVAKFLREFAEFNRGNWQASNTASDASAVVSLDPDELSFKLVAVNDAPSPAEFKVRIHKSALPLADGLGAEECVLVSAGRWQNVPLEGDQAKEQLKELRESGQAGRKDARWLPLEQSHSYAFRYGQTSLFCVAARRKDLKGKRHDQRDLAIIPEAVCTALKMIAAAGFAEVRVGAVAAGKEKSPWHPIHPFAQTLRGIRQFIVQEQVGDLRRINIHVVDPRVWYPTVAGKVPVEELLSSEVATHRVELSDKEGNVESMTLTLKESPTLAELLARCNLKREQWRVDIFPPLTEEHGSVEPSGDIVISPTMVVRLEPA